MTVRVALIGCGSWGSNILRTLVESPRVDLVAVADRSPAQLQSARRLAGGAALETSLEGAMAARPDAVVIATPSSTHAALVMKALEAGADVFVEKPLALTTQDAERCASKAASLGRIGMVGHLLRYHPAIVRMLNLVAERSIGPIHHFASARLRSGGDSTSSILWSLGPHDVSILRALDPSPIASLSAVRGGDDEGRVTLEIELESGLSARIELSRNHPTKERRLSFMGPSRIAHFDDVRAPDRVLVADSEGAGSASLRGESRGQGSDGNSIEEVRVLWREPLAVEMDHFLDCVERRICPLTPFEEGLDVVQVLAQAEMSLNPSVLPCPM